MLRYITLLPRGIACLIAAFLAVALLPILCMAKAKPLPDAKTLCEHWHKYFLSFETFQMDYTHVADEGLLEITTNCSVAVSMPKYNVTTEVHYRLKNSYTRSIVAYDGVKYQCMTAGEWNDWEMYYSTQADRYSTRHLLNMPALMHFKPIVGKDFGKGFPFTALRDEKTWESVALRIVPSSIKVVDDNFVQFKIFNTRDLKSAYLITVTVDPEVGYLPVKWQSGASFMRSECTTDGYIKVALTNKQKDAPYVPKTIRYAIVKNDARGIRKYSGTTTTDEKTLSFDPVTNPHIFTLSTDGASFVYDEDNEEYIKKPENRRGKARIVIPTPEPEKLEVIPPTLKFPTTK